MERGEVGALLHVHRSERADALVPPLAAVLATPPEDPFAADVLAVPTRGVERWLTQRLSHHLGATGAATGALGPEGTGAGICANVAFPSPGRLVADVLAAATGVAPADDPWRGDRLTWAVLRVLDDAAGEAWAAVLDRHVGAHDPPGSHRRGRRFALARHVADLLASYTVQRPDLVGAWLRGDDVDGAGGRVPDDLAWQPELTRRVRAVLEAPGPAERLGPALAALDDDPGLAGLPHRVGVWGATRLTTVQLDVLGALARHRDVHLWLLQPSPALWEGASAASTGPVPGAPGHPVTGRLPAAPRRSDRPVPARHPLLASCGQDAAELAVRVHALTATSGPGPADVSRHHPAPEPPATLLGHLQRRLRADDDNPVPGAVVSPGDRSVQVHACHGRARQVEVLRETVLRLLADDPTLEPRDVLVMCPDVEEVAPLVTATFGLAAEPLPHPGGTTPGAAAAGERAAGPHPGHGLRVRLADRSPAAVNPVLALLGQLLALADGRVTASEVLDLAARGPVRRRFDLTDDDLERLGSWTTASGTRWGEDRSRRERFGVDGVGQGTWETGVDRVLLGVAMADEEQRWLHTAVPLDDVDSTDVDLAGRLAELLDRLTLLLRELDGERDLTAWLESLERAVDLLVDTAPADAWQAVQARRVLADARQQAPPGHDAATPTAGSGRLLRLADVRALLAARLEGRPTRSSFRTGHLTVCSMAPMRSVPHRVVCLLGLDDGAFPRRTSRDGDDLLLREPLVGERDRRSEDRQLFLDAVLAAQDHLVVLYSGADERTGAWRPPAVPVGELLDALDRTATGPGGAPAREHVVVRHPLQPFDPRAFEPGALGVPGPASFDPAAFRGAQAATGPRTPPGPFLDAPLDPVREDDVELDDLVRFLEHPVRAFLRQRLGVVVAHDEDDVQDRLPLEVQGLERWTVGERLLTAALAGADQPSAVGAERRRGALPPGVLGRTALDEVLASVAPIAVAVSGYPAPTAVDVTVPLPDGRAVSGTVQVHGDVVLRATFSSLAPKHRVRAWVQLLLLAAGAPGRWSAVTIGRGVGRRATPRRSVLSAPPADDAALWLEQLVDLRDRGLRQPLPMAVRTSAAYATSRFAGDAVEQAVASAAEQWRLTRFGTGDSADREHELVWGRGAPLAVLLDPPASGGEQEWWLDEPTRFGALARRLWEPLLRHERTAAL
ncbi:exodeoxyribonuclease V subunit gamma [Thalassiella azotivora]